MVATSNGRGVAISLPNCPANVELRVNRTIGSAARRAGITLGIVIGSALRAASNAIHLELWSRSYGTILTIAPLVLVQVIAGTFLAVLLLLSRRLLMVAASSGFMITTISGLLLSVHVGHFGFMDSLQAPYAGLSLGVETAGAVVLALIGTVLVRGHGQSDQGTPHMVEANTNGVFKPGAVESALCLPAWSGRRNSNPRSSVWQGGGFVLALGSSPPRCCLVHPVSISSTQSVPVVARSTTGAFSRAKANALNAIRAIREP